MPADRLIHPRLGHSEKVTALSDLEYRVWMTYELTADDYGVMRKSAVTVQAADDSLAKRPAKLIDAALERLVAVGLIQQFDHQGRRYVYQESWQNFQRVKHPRDTMQPIPPADAVRKCSPATQKLFLNHPSTRAEELPQDFGNISETDQKEKSELGSLACAGTRETANGQRLVANGSESEGSVRGTPPMDLWARELVNLYPAQGRCGALMVERPLFSALTGNSGDPWETWDALRAALEQHKRSHQWRVKQMIPRLDKWLREGLYLQELPETPVATLVNERNARSFTSAAEFIKGGDSGAR